MAEGHSSACLQGSDQLPTAGMMGPQAAHVQELKPRLRNPFRSGIAKERGWQGPHRHAQPLAHKGEQRRIEAEQHGVVGLGLQVRRENIQWTLSVVQITADEEPRAWPITETAQRMVTE